jgi:DNA-binding IclR family transcriptional regulator
MMSRDSSERGAQAVYRALAMLELFSTQFPSLSLKEICERTGLTMPTAHRIAKALHSSGFLVHDPLRGRYTLGPAVVRLAYIVLRNSDTSMLVGIAMPYLEGLRAETGESVGLHIPTDGGRVCVAEVESWNMMRMATGVGKVMPWHAGAASKAMLGLMSDDDQRRLLTSRNAEALTEATIVDPVQMREALVKVREQGYAISEGESVPGAAAISKAVLNPDNRVIAAVNITGPAARWSRKQMLEALPHLEKAVVTIETLLGRTPA